MARSKGFYTEYGVSGLNRFGGIVNEEYLSELRGEDGRKTLKNMSSTDPTIGALLFVIKQLTKAADWEVRESSGNTYKDNSACAQFIWECLNDMSTSWKSTISSICSMYTYGFDYREVCYKVRDGRDAKVPSAYSDGRVGIRKLATRSQTTIKEWEFDDSGGIRGAIQEDPVSAKKIFLPIEKCLLFRTEDSSGNPEGRSIIASAYIPWFFLKNYRELEGIGVERDVTGVIKVRLPSDMFTDANLSSQLSEWKNLVSNLRRDELDGLLLPYDANNPELYNVDLMKSPGEKMFDIGSIIDRLKAEMAQVCLTDFILLGHEGVGSFALARSKQDALGIAVAGWLDIIAGTLNSHLVPKLVKMNPEFESIEHYPEIVPRMAKVPSYEEVSSLVRSLAFASFHVSANRELLNSILDSYGLPKVDEETYEDLTNNAIDGKILPGKNNEYRDEGDIEEKGVDSGGSPFGGA
jgi:hypothetical protein